MPRLTRTQKFADLRDSLANDREEKIATQELTSFENRLNNVQENLAFNSSASDQLKQEIKEKLREEVNQKRYEEPVKDNSEYAWTSLGNDSNKYMQDANSYVNMMPEDNAQEIKEVPIDEEPAQKNDSDSYFNQFVAEQAVQKKHDDFNSYFEPKVGNVFNDVSDDSGEIISQKERDTYLNQTIYDVHEYNVNNGEQTINTTVDSIIDEVRHSNDFDTLNKTEFKEVTPILESEAPVDNTYAWSPVDEAALDADKIENDVQDVIEDDDEFSRTVTTEISAIMAGLSLANEDKKVEENKSVSIQEPIRIDETVAEEKAEEVVEIKNIAEVEAEEANTMSSTIPFVVAAEDEDVIEEYEEEGSNTVLNVILIVLIVVLLAVLGLIVFYILKTKGIF